MARTYARVLTELWSDPRWLELGGDAQRLYLLVMSQPRLSLVGVIDYMPDRWAGLASNTTTDDVARAVGELNETGFFAVDYRTAEVLVPSFFGHDLSPARFNVNLVKGVWSAWGQLSSLTLRQMLARLIPEPIWTHDRVPPPRDAMQMRRSEATILSVGTDRIDGPSTQTIPTAYHMQLSDRSIGPICGQLCDCVNGFSVDGEGVAHRCQHGR